MQKILAGFAAWWQGKKTIVGGVLIMAAGAAGVWYGKLDPVTGLGIVGSGLSVSGFAAKANRHQAEILSALEAVARAGAQARQGAFTYNALKADAAPLVADALSSGVLQPFPSSTVATVGGPPK